MTFAIFSGHTTQNIWQLNDFFQKRLFFSKILWNGRVAVVVQDYLVEHQQW